MGRHPLIRVTDEELSRGHNVTHSRHRRSIVEVSLLFSCRPLCKVEVLIVAASIDPIGDVCGVDHVGHVENGVPKRGRLPHVFVVAMAD